MFENHSILDVPRDLVEKTSFGSAFVSFDEYRVVVSGKSYGGEEIDTVRHDGSEVKMWFVVTVEE